MVLKRLLVTTLGALGLGALAAGPALGQGEGNIPAPDIFNDQITCSMLVPSVGGMTALNTPTRLVGDNKKSALDDLIGMGTVMLTDAALNAAAAIDEAFDADDAAAAIATLGTLGYVIPPHHSNCGADPDGMEPLTGPMFGAEDNDANAEVMDGMFEDGMFEDGDTIGASSIPIDVAAGYSELLPLFEAVYGNPGETTGGTFRVLTAAQKALSDAIEDGLTGTALTSLQTAITTAQEAHNKAVAKFTDASGGPIYQAGVAEWMAKAAVTKSIADYNKQVGEANTAQIELDELDYGSYVPLGNDRLIAAGPQSEPAVVTFNTDGTVSVNTSLLTEYNGALLSADPQVATVDMDGVTTTDDSNFDQAGNLIVPMDLVDHDMDDDTDMVLRPVVVDDTSGLTPVVSGTNIHSVENIREVVERYNAAAAELKRLRDENVVSSVQDAYNDAYDRAQAEADYYNQEWARVLSDNDDKRTDQQKLRYLDNGDPNDMGDGAYIENPVTIASKNAAYTTESNKRFTAEQTLRAAVAAREAATDAVVAAFSSPQDFYNQLVARRQALKVTADRAVTSATADGGTAPENVVDAAADAAEALADAQESRDNLLGLFADADDPTVALVEELLKNDGDDGQALVDAISATYETAAGAADAAREVVAELTGEGGAVSMNTSMIEGNTEAIVELEGEVWDAAGNSRIDMNETRSTENRSMIATNSGLIATNAGNIMGLRTDVDSNMGRIGQNETDILMNAGNIADNTTAIGVNSDAIASNMNSIGSNSSAISDNRNMIGELSESLEVVRAGVAASMALAGMPAINGRGISIGVGSFDGESAFAVGFQIQGEMASFKVGLTSGGGATGASAGVGFQF